MAHPDRRHELTPTADAGDLRRVLFHPDGSRLLTLVAAAEGASLDSTLFGEKLLLSFTTVRISTDSVYGWEEKTPSTKPEIIVLALIGWFHWLLLSVAGAIIVTRAVEAAAAGGVRAGCHNERRGDLPSVSSRCDPPCCCTTCRFT